MSDIALAVACDQRHGHAPDANRRVAVSGSQKDVLQCAVDVRIVRGEPAERRAQDIAVGDHGAARGVGMGNAAARIHEQHACAQPVERVGERGGLRGLELDEFSDQHGAAKVRNQKPQPLARRLVGETFALMAKQRETCVAFGRSVEIDNDVVDPALRPDTLLIEARLQKLGMRHDRSTC